MENLPSFGDALWPCPGKSSVMTRYSFANAGTCAVQDELSQVQPCTNTIVGPAPTDEEWIDSPSTEAAESGAAAGTARMRAKSNRRMIFSVA